jgi:hypothetical protein
MDTFGIFSFIYRPLHTPSEPLDAVSSSPISGVECAPEYAAEYAIENTLWALAFAGNRNVRQHGRIRKEKDGLEGKGQRKLTRAWTPRPPAVPMGKRTDFTDDCRADHGWRW